MATEPLPVTGAWAAWAIRPATAKFFTFATDHPFAVESGAVLRDVTVAYETWGTLNSDASNAVLICHAWTGDSHAAGRAGAGHVAPGWWDDVDRSRQATSTRTSSSWCAPTCSAAARARPGRRRRIPTTAVRTGRAFPVVTIRDMVRHQAQLMRHLGIERWACVIGGSMGGMQVLEWAITYPDRVRSIVPIATLHAGQRPADRVGRDRSPGDPARPAVGGAATTTTPSPATARRRDSRSHVRSPRSRSAATTCSPSASVAA